MTLKNSFLADGQENKNIENEILADRCENKNGRENKKARNGFAADVFENMKRRNWVFWLSFLSFICYFPGFLVLRLNSIRSVYENADAIGLIRMNERMDETVEALFGLNGFMPVIVIGLAILIGMQGFVYLHNKRQVDFYHSQPVSRKRRFLVLWFNGIVIFVVTYLINMLLGMVVAAAYGTMSGVILGGALKAFLLYFLLFLGIYHISIIAVLLTGNTLVSLLAMAVLLGYEIAARAMAVVMAASFFLTFGSGEEEKIFDTILSPIVNIYKHIILSGREYNYSQYADKSYTYGGTAVGLLILAVFFGVVSFFLYEKRASESHGNSISFPKIKEILRFALLLLIGSFGTYVIYYVAGKSVALGIAGAVFFIALGHAVIQLIYEVDFRAIRKKWLTAIISLASVILIFLGFKYDWIGYDSKIPKQSQVESVYLSLAAEGFANNQRVMLDGTEIYHLSYAKRNMELTDLDTIYELLENRERIKRTTVEFDGTYETVRITFRLKNGKTQSRCLYFKYEENLGVLDKIYHMEEYQLANNQVLEENFVENYKIVSINYSDGNGEEIIPPSSIDVNEFVEAYKKDLENSSYTEVYYNIPIGRATLCGIGFQDEHYRNQWQLLIYDSYKNTLELLEEAGVSCRAVFDENYISKIQKIEVRFDDYQRMETEPGLTWEEYHKTAIYNTKEMYEKILQNAVPGSNRWWATNSRHNDGGYIIYIYTPNLYDINDYYMDEVYFQTGEMPDFILEDLEKISYGEEMIIAE